MKVFANAVLIVAMAVWAGMIIGVSLIATPVKFQAHSLTLPVALDVGRTTFRFLGAIELGFIVVIIAAGFLARANVAVAVMLGLVVVQALLQRYWLLPVLNAQVDRVLAGQTGPSSFHHALFVRMEVLKSVLLIAGSVVRLRP